MPNVRDLVEYIRVIDRLHVAVGLNGRTLLDQDFERFRSMPGGVTVSEYLAKRVRPYLPAGTTMAIYDPFGRMVTMTALLENIRLPEPAHAPVASPRHR